MCVAEEQAGAQSRYVAALNLDLSFQLRMPMSPKGGMLGLAAACLETGGRHGKVLRSDDVDPCDMLGEPERDSL